MEIGIVRCQEKKKKVTPPSYTRLQGITKIPYNSIHNRRTRNNHIYYIIIHKKTYTKKLPKQQTTGDPKKTQHNTTTIYAVFLRQHPKRHSFRCLIPSMIMAIK